MTREISIAVSCTDRGQHPWISLGDLTWDSGLLRANTGYSYGTVADRRKAELVWLDHLDPLSPEYRVHMKCPRCQRHVEWSHVTLVKVRDALLAADTPRVDISRLP